MIPFLEESRVFEVVVPSGVGADSMVPVRYFSPGVVNGLMMVTQLATAVFLSFLTIAFSVQWLYSLPAWMGATSLAWYLLTRDRSWKNRETEVNDRSGGLLLFTRSVLESAYQRIGSALIVGNCSLFATLAEDRGNRLICICGDPASAIAVGVQVQGANTTDTSQLHFRELTSVIIAGPSPRLTSPWYIERLLLRSRLFLLVGFIGFVFVFSIFSSSITACIAAVFAILFACRGLRSGNSFNAGAARLYELDKFNGDLTVVNGQHVPWSWQDGYWMEVSGDRDLSWNRENFVACRYLRVRYGTNDQFSMDGGI